MSVKDENKVRRRGGKKVKRRGFRIQGRRGDEEIARWEEGTRREK